uniref:VWFA domain-containing protein n=1 Tax=Varanus komodoensis TaxID=61221 RepID=A0A8D2PZA4_VARKO
SDYSYICKCHEGFILRDDGKTCRNQDICNSIEHGCEHICVNNDDSYTCKCHGGFILRDDGKTCRNQDVCKFIDHGCEHVCVNHDDSYTCQCHEGFILMEDGKTCRSKDPCKSVMHGCEHICMNNNNSYICKCHEGYILEENRKTCRRCDEGPIDLVFVIDGSKSLGENNFEIVKEFVLGILDSLTISPKSARVGLLQYSTQVRTEFTLKQFSTAKDMKKAVSQMKYMGKGSMTGLALKQMTERSFTEAEGGRHSSAKVPRVSIVFTDGRAQDEVSEWATKAKQRGITIYAIGIGKAIEEELREIASDPPAKHLFYAEDFSAMGEITEKLQKRICDGIKHHIVFYLSVTIFLSPTNISGTPSADKKDLCKCENLITFQNFANAEVRKLTQQHILLIN